ncbi:MAG: translation initiation factor IF-2 [Candidatus Melainabacteria bacterium]|nr:translation initiation factor IF-2 [Candidatus Melainabacteria bacterium]
MDDRVRIYELARKMNLANQDIITTLRELGYDIKSHSSTIDKQAVGQLIAAIDKKKKGAEEAKAKGSKNVAKAPVTAPAGKPAAKTTIGGSAKGQTKLPPPPEPVVVKPRVLSRYRPERPLSETAGTEAGHPQSGAVTNVNTPNQPASTAAATSPAASNAAAPTTAQSNLQSQAPAHSGSEQTAPASTAAETQANPVSAPQAANQPGGSQSQGAAAGPKTESQTGSTAASPAATVAPAGSTGMKPASPVSGREPDTGSAACVKPAEAAPEVEVEEPAAPSFEELDPIIRPTGDEWSDGSKYAPRVIRKLDQPPKTKKVEEEPVKPAKVEPERYGKKEKNKDAEREEKHEPRGKKIADLPPDEDEEIIDLKGQAVRPLSPSVPIRIAAPSMRATPPRPPKSHRQSPSDRHGAKKEEKVRPTAAVVEVPKSIVLTNSLTVQDLASRMGVAETEVIKRLFMKGVMRTVNQMVELELARELAVEMEYEVLSEEVKDASLEEAPKELSEEDKANLVTRPPVVTIMGHVDHGKTSLLDAIRQTKFNLTDSEHGGITQHIGAYHVEVPDEEGHMRQIVFLDTPGHEAFTAMRARGAKATDIAILVVAADDGVMPQTIEALDHAKAAGVPIIVAVNKIDKAEADPERVLTQLMKHDLVAEKYGGDTVTVEVSAKKRLGLDNLLEMILLVSDILDLKANPEKPAEGVIVEAELSRGKGAVATALVENGTLREGDFIVAGSKCGRVRALFDDRGQRVKAAGPSMPVEVLGLDEVPLAGDRFEVVDDAQGMKMLAEARRLTETKAQHHVTLESLHDLLESGEVKELNIIVKADVQGTAEAIADSIRKLSSSEVQTRVLRTASGDISENDVNLAASSNAIIVGFNVQPDQNGARVAEANGVDIRTYTIIYQITDDITSAVQGLLKPIRQEIQIGQAEVRQIFKVGKGLMIAGCMVLSGKVQRSSIARIERDGQVIYEGKLDTLKRFKDDAKEVAQGFECGMSFEKFSDLQVGDKINSFIIQETKRDASN